MNFFTNYGLELLANLNTKQMNKMRPLMPHEHTLWLTISKWLRTTQGYTYAERENLKFTLSNIPDGFKRFYEIEILKK